MNTFLFYSTHLDCFAVLLYLYNLNKDIVNNIEIIDVKSTKILMYMDWEKDINEAISSLGYGEHNIKWNNKNINVIVNKYHGTKILHSYDMRRPEIIKEIIITGENITNEDISNIIKESKDYLSDLLGTDMSTEKIKKYIYQEERWDLMNSTNSRDYDSLFLKNKDKEELFNYVNDFLSKETKKDYIKYNIPYKCNILLYGKPGTGKTTTILALASKFNLNIGIIPLSAKLDDIELVYAMNSLKKINCRILVLEDIDCIFTERKVNDSYKNSVTLSGLLNCLDGLFRNEGIIVVLTANNINNIDEAMLRSSRIDFKLKYEYADKEQTFECFKYYFPQKLDLFDSFYKIIKNKDYTIATLQTFFFKHRKKDNIIDYIDDIDYNILGKKCDEISNNIQEHLYT